VTTEFEDIDETLPDVESSSDEESDGEVKEISEILPKSNRQWLLESPPDALLGPSLTSFYFANALTKYKGKGNKLVYSSFHYDQYSTESTEIESFVPPPSFPISTRLFPRISLTSSGLWRILQMVKPKTKFNFTSLPESPRIQSCGVGRVICDEVVDVIDRYF
jgi:hypothetical protein